MTTKTKRLAKPTPEPKTLRASVSFPHELYSTLERIAKEKKVSVAWIVREAADRYVSEQWPLFSTDNRKNITV